ncbi:1-hydroxycarotenoid 3,4-desaturase CrtD [Palleronia sediminis]|nr:1-hydroxycarotenoid 3,4-desaturase CrtD [Palleronia sediminis]
MSAQRIIIVGAGIGGLAAAMRLAAEGCDVTVLESQDSPGGKLRTLPSAAGPVDTGPTVLTLRGVFEALFAEAGQSLSDHATLTAEPVLARHFWPDGTTLDLFTDEEASAAAIDGFAGATAARQFRAFAARARRLFDRFEGPILRAPRPSLGAVGMAVARDPAILRDMVPHRALGPMLDGAFDDPRLAQLFARYSTYVGGTPQHSPALLALIWEAEAAGVWRVEGGMHRLAHAMHDAAIAASARFAFGTGAAEIEVANGRAVAVRDVHGTRHPADAVLFAGDPRALGEGLLGRGVVGAVPSRATAPRSLSAVVHAFAATPSGPDLHHHNVFFGADRATEFTPLARGRAPVDPTVYICAQDRGTGRSPPWLERFETIVNAAPLASLQGETPCHTETTALLKTRGLMLDPPPRAVTRTDPRGFATLFPGSLGALYGRSPEGTMAAFARPTAQSRIAGLFLAGGATHPGAGVPMAALSGRHAAETILNVRTSISRCLRTGIAGGMSTGSATTRPAASRSSGS